MLLEYLAGETGEQREQNASSQISRLFIVGNSLAPVAMNIEKQRSIIEAGPKSVRNFLWCPSSHVFIIFPETIWSGHQHFLYCAN